MLVPPVLSLMVVTSPFWSRPVADRWRQVKASPVLVFPEPNKLGCGHENRCLTSSSLEILSLVLLSLAMQGAAPL
jgi:hypothetical protein